MSFETTVCATHPERHATLTCERCGSFACTDCAVDAPWGASMCSTCEVRGELRYPLQWEHGSPWNPLCFLRSAGVILRDAPQLFANLPEGHVARALGFCVWIALCLACSSIIADAWLLQVDWGEAAQRRAVLSYAGLLQLLASFGRTFGLVLISACGFHLAARAVGGHAPMQVALRTASYGSAFLLYNVGITFLSAIAPWLELAGIVVVALTQGYFYFTCLSLTASTRYGLPKGRAEAAAGFTLGALLPSVVLVTLVLTLTSNYVQPYMEQLQR